MRTLKNFEGKNIFVILNTIPLRRYTGKCIEVSYLGKNEDGGDVHLLTIIDKFGNFVSFSSEEIQVLEEEFEKNKKKEVKNGDKQ